MQLGVLAGLTPPDVECVLYDDRIETIPYDEPTDLVAISVETFTALRAYKIARQFRARDVPVVMGGYHVQTDNVEGLAMGRKIAQFTWPRIQQYFDGTALAPKE